MRNIISIIYVIIIVFFFIKGYNLGFLKQIFSFASLIITILLTRLLTPVFSQFVKDFTNIEATLSDIVYKNVIENNDFDKINLGVFENILSTDDLGNTIHDKLCDNIANVIINLICGIIVFIVIFILIKLILKILDFIDYIPILGKLNKLAGGLLSDIEVIIVSWIVFIILNVLQNINQISVLIANIKQSFIVGYIYNHNLLEDLFSNLFSIFSKT